MKKLIIKKQVIADKWFLVKWKNGFEACCDCGLVHGCDYKVVKVKLYKKVYVENVLTKEARSRFSFIATRYKNEPISVAWYDKNDKVIFRKNLK